MEPKEIRRDPAQTLVPPGRPIGTASRLHSGMRSTNKFADFNVDHRPVTQQGLKVIEKTSRVSYRKVEDKPYYIGVLRSKTNELIAELAALNRQIQEATEENSSYVQYEKMAEKCASEIKQLQGEMGDYNTLVEKLTIGEHMGNVQLDYEALCASNDRMENSLNNLFEERTRLESELKSVESHLDQSRRLTDTLVSNMPTSMRQKYQDMTRTNVNLLTQIEKSRQEIDKLNSRKAELEDELSTSQMKQEAYRLLQQLRDAKEKRDQLVGQTQSSSDPQQERERLLAQVKEDNQELATMEKQIKESRDTLSRLEAEINNTVQDLQDCNSDRTNQIKELRKREAEIDAFLETFESQKSADEERITILQANNVSLLESISRSMGREGHMQQLPSSGEFKGMKQQLAFKQSEAQKAESTTTILGEEHNKLRNDFMKVEQLGTKLKLEDQSLKERKATMESELEKFSNLSQLKADAEERETMLKDLHDHLKERTGTLKRYVQHLSKEYEALKKQLQDNDTHTQLCALERRWTYLEQNNFVMKESIAIKSLECDFEAFAKNVKAKLVEFNKEVIQDVSARTQL